MSPGQRRRLSAAAVQALLTAGLLVARLCLGAEPGEWGAPRSVPVLESVSQLDDAINQLRRMSWGLFSAEYTQDADSRGRTLKNDIDQWLMTSATTARLESLRSQAQNAVAAHLDGALHKALLEAATITEQEAYRAFVLNSYWFYQDNAAAHRHNLDGLEARLPSEVDARRARLGALLEAFARQLVAAETLVNADIAQQDAVTASFTAARKELFRAYNQERGKLASAVSRAERNAGRPPESRGRETPCRDAGTPTYCKPVPTFMAGLETTEKYYPASAKHLQYEGEMILEATTSATGCIEKVSVSESSGVAALDAAGISWTLEAGRMLPAEHDGKPVAASVYFRFRLTLSQ